MTLFSKVLVANRGEIAVRVFRTLRELGIGTVAVYSEADRHAVHVRRADEAYLIGPGPANQSYLVWERVIEAAQRSGAQAIHPGYGFLAENARFAEAVEAAGITWIGPPPSAIDAMGSKTAARDLMKKAGVPIVPGTTEPVTSAAEVAQLGDEMGWPVAIKAAAGGGGKGIKVVRGRDEVESAYASAKREGLAYFGDDTIYVEKYIENPRHVEVQVLADSHGNCIHLGERDCSIQRRHQKLIEETPSPAVDAALREHIGQIAVNAALAVGYRSAGTIEGLLSHTGEYYFLEMNTRIQVEHTVTEMVTGLDLIREQVLIAAGQPMSIRQEDVVVRGHAFECRINAENPSSGFLPSPGLITHYKEPTGIGVRVDSGVEAGSEIAPLYDPMIAKLIVHDTNRETARRRMLRALDEFEVGGVKSLLGFHRALLRHPAFIEGGTCHGIVESELLAQQAEELSVEEFPEAAAGAAAGNGRGAGGLRERALQVELNGRRFDVKIQEPTPEFVALGHRRRERELSGGGHAAATEAVVSPMQGTMLAVKVAEGETVRAGQVLCIIEAMKMENEVTAHRDGVVQNITSGPGQPVKTGQVICLVVAGDGTDAGDAGSDD